MGIPKCRLTTGRPWTGGDLKAVLLAVVDAWDAKYAVVRGSRFSESLPRAKNGYIWPWPGWLTYLTSPHSRLVWPPDDIKTERFANGAMLATLCDEPLDVDNPRHLELAHDMHKALGPAQKIWD